MSRRRLCSQKLVPCLIDLFWREDAIPHEDLANGRNRRGIGAEAGLLGGING